MTRLLVGNALRVVGVVALGFLFVVGAARLGCAPTWINRPPPADPRAADPGWASAPSQLQAEPSFVPLAAGLDLLQQERYDHAEAEFRSRMGDPALEPDARALAAVYAASAALAAERPDAARKLYLEARAMAPAARSRFSWHGTMGWLASRLGYHEEALQDFRGLRSDPQFGPGDHLSLAYAQERMGHTADARRSLDRALEGGEDPLVGVQALSLLAWLDLKSPRAAQAPQRMAEAVERALAGLPPGDPTRADARRQYAEVLLWTGETRGAEAACAVLEGGEEDSLVRGLVAEARGRLAEAEALVRKATKEEADPALEAANWLTLAQIHQAQGRADQALGDLQRARELLARCPQPGPADRAWLLLVAAQLEGDPRAAEEGLRLVREAGYTGGPWLAMALVIHGDALKSPESYEEALRVLDESVGRRTRDAGYALRGLARLARDPEERRRLRQEAVTALEASLGPEHPHLTEARKDLQR